MLAPLGNKAPRHGLAVGTCVLGTDHSHRGEEPVNRFLHLWSDESGQDIAEYAVMLAVILVIVVGTVRLIGSNANMVFSQAASSIR